MLWIRKEKSSKKKEGLIWEDNLMKNCQDLNMYYEWVHDIEDVLKVYGRKLPRKKFIDEFNELRVLNKTESLRQDEILLSPSEIDEFKVNLKNSVLLSYGQAMKPPRPKQNSKIQTIIYSTTSKANQKNLNLSASFNNPPTHSASRKRSDIHLQENRKQTILKQRERALRQSFSKSGFRQSIMSFVDDTMTTLLRGHQKEISKQSAHSLEVFVKFSLILEKHLTNRENIMCLFIEAFTNYIYKKYTIFTSSENLKKQSQPSEVEKQKQVLFLQDIEQSWKKKAKNQRFKQLENRKSLTAEQIEELTSDIKIFLVLLRQIVQDYYKTAQFTYETLIETDDSSRDFENINTNSLITNEDNLLILVTGVLFKNEKFYTHTINIFKKFHAEREKNFKNIIDSLRDRAPEYFEIKRQYCLNSYTLQKYKPKEPQKALSTVIEKTTQEKELEANKNANKQQKIVDQKAISASNSTLAQKLNKPYKKCSQTLQKMPKSKTPTSKMKVIMECSQKITQSVAQFYNQNGLELKNQVLDADQVLSIFCYVLSTCPIENIHANLFMIQHFATQNQMISITGYYYSVLTIAVEQLENMYSSTVADMESLAKTQSYNSKMSGKTKNKRSKSNSKSIGKKNKDVKKRSFQKAD